MPDEASLIITNSGIPGVVPSPDFLAHGELALNWADAALYFKDMFDQVRTITTIGGEPIILTAELPGNEGIWATLNFPGTPTNTAYVIVTKDTLSAPRLKIGSIVAPNSSISVEGADITVSIIAGTTTNQIKALIESNAAAYALIYFYNAPGSDGSGVATPLPIGSAAFVEANTASGVRADFLGQSLVVNHSDETTSEWYASKIRPTRWMPRTPGIIYNRSSEQWERTFVDAGTIQTELLPDQE
jgi:hypothetical protein